MKIKPNGYNMLVQPIERKQILVGDTGSKCEYGKVIDVGENVKNAKIGDTIGHTIWGVRSLDVQDSNEKEGFKRYYFVPDDERFFLCKIEEIEQ